MWHEYDARPCSSSEEVSNDFDSLLRHHRFSSHSSENRSLGRHSGNNAFRRIPEYASIRRKPPLAELEAELISLHGSERGIDVSSPPLLSHSLPPRPPARHSSSKLGRPPPPPYNPTLKFSKSLSNTSKPPPPYPGRCITPTRKCDFKPQDSSTPKSDNEEVVGEGELRLIVRDKDERAQKALSIYENVDCDRKNGSTLWYEYGCV